MRRAAARPARKSAGSGPFSGFTVQFRETFAQRPPSMMWFSSKWFRSVVVGLAALTGALTVTPAAEAQYGRTSADRGAVPGKFDHYVLALSWSPGFCEREGRRKQRSQCDAGRGMGFVVHGLWPQYANNGYPSECAPAPRFPSRTALQVAQGVFPDEGLARHEWRIHGTCSGNTAVDYYRDVRRSREAVIIPDVYRNVSSVFRSNVMELKRAFVAANPRLRADMMDVSCARGALQEIYICFSKDLRGFQPCGDMGPPRCRSGFQVQPPQ